MKVAVLGAAGGIGQPLSMILKNSLPAGSKLGLYDVAPFTPGVAVDLSHIPTDVEVQGFTGEDLPKALEGADVVVIPAGVARKPGMTRDDLFNINAGIIANLVRNCARVCPKACICIITNPVNSTVPLAAEVLKAEGVYDKHRLFGVSALDVLRSETFLAAELGISNQRILVPVIGGHSGTTIIPLLSKVIGHEKIAADRIKALTDRIQNAGTEVVEAKAGAGSATLSMATAGARFALKVVKGLMGEPGVNEYAYVEGGSKVAPFFAQAVRFGKNGWDEVIDYGTVSDFEQKLIDEAAPQLATNIKKGVDFAQKWLSENK
ncbi:malate dehydrogenase [Succinivibrio dextrinosolvens]|uniref:Malate dehydrogenase n=1 Tax=Succinivibrio dextrinosolvens DSM 3072 TaxID=1123324 RepID=A0A1T4VV43_9GAMM|nr:malate dehydrogenase [Succinivibrio dextrinosolvens]SKA68708.1 malate dehydrogenase (NAD) [Succinivibrio dextrinosolvens DSM 3072]